MLQICSGKLFKREAEYRNNLKGIIYTNLMLMREQKLETKAGTIVATANVHKSNAIIYEIEELIEACGDGPGVLASHGIDSLILDFSSIFSFALNCTASPSYMLTDRLLGDQLGVTTHSIPKKIVKQVFDKNIYCQVKDEEFFIKFTNQLIGLDRKTYLGVMSSIKTYVTGMHRIADDFELAYTLLVASIESLAQNFDGHQSTWSDYDSKKKKVIDEALSDADDQIADKVRKAILLNEHTSLSKRFREFSIKHISPAYYREEAENTVNPISSFDLPIALSNAYLARSKYIHNLKKLPKPLDRDTSYTETCRIENKTWLTLQGLSRLARQIIIEFTMRQTTVEKELYNYNLERSNIMQVELSPEYWIWKLDFSRGSGSQKLKGFLSQLASCMEHVPNSSVTELTKVLDEVERKIDSFQKEDKRAYIALYIAYYHFFSDPNKREKHLEFIKYYEKEILISCTEGLIIIHLLNITPSWDLQSHYDCITQYFKERDHKGKIRFPKIFEVGMILQLAERYRLNDDETKVIELIGMAVESYPEHAALRQFEKDYKLESHTIAWEKILSPPKDPEINKTE